MRWFNNGQSVKVPVGNYRIFFKELDGYQTPQDVVVNINKNQTVIINQKYLLSLPENQIKINNTILTYNNIIYTDAVNGNDTGGNGTRNNPYKTFDKAYSVAVSGEAVYLKEGTYTRTATNYGVTFNKNGVSVIGDAGKTIIINNSTPSISYGGFVNIPTVTSTTSIVYNIIFKGNKTWFSAVNDHDSYNTSRRFTFYNCVFDVQTSNISYQNGSQPNMYNCVFTTTANRIYVNRAGYRYTNCAFRTTSAFSNSYGSGGYTMKTVLRSCVYDSDYNITSPLTWINSGTGLNPDGTQAHIGVYGGEFAW